MDLTKKIWEGKKTYDGNTLSKSTYIKSICGWTSYGLVLAGILAYFSMSLNFGLFSFLFLGLVVPILGIVIALRSTNWKVSLVGYNMIIFGFGLIVGPTVAMYETGVIMGALFATGGTTVVMSFIGIIYPKSLESWSVYLIGGLLALISVRVVQIVMLSMGIEESIWYMNWIEYLGVLLFSALIIYDWNRALRLPYTLGNSIISAIGVFLDFFNMFLMILRIKK